MFLLGTWKMKGLQLKFFQNCTRPYGLVNLMLLMQIYTRAHPTASCD